MSGIEISIAAEFRDFVEKELLPDLGIDAGDYWRGLEKIIDGLSPENRELITRRDALQEKIDDYHREHPATSWDAAQYREFLREIDYLEAGGDRFQIETSNVDAEIASIAGPQLVVPVNNARFALNAANARWGSLYDALYGTDVISEDDGREKGSAYNARRGDAVIAYAADFLDRAVPLQDGSHNDVTAYNIDTSQSSAALSVELGDGTSTSLAVAEQFIAFSEADGSQSILLQNHGLHIEIVINRKHPIGKTSAAGVSDVILESAVTTIQDCEDSVTAVDAADKVEVYRNWLGLMRGTLSVTFDKAGKPLKRELNGDRVYTSISGDSVSLPGRSLLLVRNVGHLMTTDAVFDRDGNEVFEGILDAVITSTCALYDLRAAGRVANSRSGSVYIVKPKMHGSSEAAFANKLFAAVEDMLGLDRYTLKIGVMDEERRTTINLEECMRAVKNRLVFINTGFLDRTGDEIHTSMVGGPMLPKEQIKAQAWINAYEDRNVDIGIRCGMPGRAQIGKGMWPKPDEMRQMVDTKQAHPESGANCAWVPSPTAATLHAMHYHYVDVAARQRELTSRELANLDDILQPPFGDPAELTADTIQQELENNAQGILGYVVRWIDQGVGCSKVPDIDDVGLMEDRATLRISSQHIANWLYHGICTEAQVMETFQRMAKVVDAQNAHDDAYENMAPGFDGIAFQAACELALQGTSQPNGYTEPLLHEYRRVKKRDAAAS
ncbi:MAG: malate synthase G [Woeseiaceae bacterium]